MSDKNDLSNDGIKFLSIITASFTHELNNVLGTVEQLLGLLEDLAFTLESDNKSLSEQMNSISSRINSQVLRGTNLIKRLNGVAHTSDSQSASFNVYDAVENLMSLMERLARIKKVNLELEKPETTITIVGNAFLFVQIVFFSINRILPFVNEDSAIRISLFEKNENLRVVICAEHENSITELESGNSIDRLLSTVPCEIIEEIMEKNYRCSLEF